MGDDLDGASGSRRARNKEREQSEEPQKSYGTILEQEIAAGLTELERPALGLLLSGLSAGLDVSAVPEAGPGDRPHTAVPAVTAAGNVGPEV